jgi:protein PhnA
MVLSGSIEKCEKCQSPHVYEDGHLWVCPECGHEVSQLASASATHEPSNLSGDSGESGGAAVRDANGNVLNDGDTVTVLKELRIKGSSSVVKVGTKVKGIRLVDAADGHDISCKIDGIGAIHLKSEFVRKA